MSVVLAGGVSSGHLKQMWSQKTMTYMISVASPCLLFSGTQFVGGPLGMERGYVADYPRNQSGTLGYHELHGMTVIQCSVVLTIFGSGEVNHSMVYRCSAVLLRESIQLETGRNTQLQLIWEGVTEGKHQVYQPCRNPWETPSKASCFRDAGLLVT